MTRVAVLAHVKEATVEPMSNPAMGPRVAWSGGKISSNKREAFRKFYERKVRSGAAMTAEQQRLMEMTLQALEEEDENMETKASHGKRKLVSLKGKARRKVTGAKESETRVLITGRVLGPRVEAKAKAKANSKATQGIEANGGVKRVGKKTRPQPRPRIEASAMALQEQLDMPLEVLVQRRARC